MEIFKIFKRTPTKRKVWEVKSIRKQTYFIVQRGHCIFSIEDYNISRDYSGPMKFSKEDAEKLARFLNHFYKGSSYIFHGKIYDRIKMQLKLETGVYFLDYKII